MEQILRVGDVVYWDNSEEPSFLDNYRNGIITAISKHSYRVKWPNYEESIEHNQNYIFLEQTIPLDEMGEAEERWRVFFGLN